MTAKTKAAQLSLVANENKPELHNVKARGQQNILGLSAAVARNFLLKGESYCNFDLPSYFAFDKILQDVSKSLAGKRLSDFHIAKPWDFDDLNHVILNNKDGKYAWRPFKLIHPAAYVDIVSTLTEKNNWAFIKERFRQFSVSPQIECSSLPVKADSKKKDRAAQILHWWEEVEQRSIELSLDYEYLTQTDITDCYGSIYTHSISWALHGKSVAKTKRDDMSLVGNVIDRGIQRISFSQTNGIPQGSVLMDFVAEMVLGYADLELLKKLEASNVKDYHILRYRDDYKIFTNNPQNGETILKILTEVLIDLGMRLNPSKTKATDRVISGSIKADKLYWIRQRQTDKSLQKHLLILHDLASKYPNSGSLVAALKGYYERLLKGEDKIQNVVQLISITADIALHNPRTYSFASAILSLLLERISGDDQKQAIVNKIIKRFARVPNIGHLQIWLQRITLPLNGSFDFDEPLCKIAAGESPVLWNSSWLRPEISKLIDSTNIVDIGKIKKLSTVISQAEFDVFAELVWSY